MEVSIDYSGRRGGPPQRAFVMATDRYDIDDLSLVRLRNGAGWLQRLLYRLLERAGGLEPRKIRVCRPIAFDAESVLDAVRGQIKECWKAGQEPALVLVGRADMSEMTGEHFTILQRTFGWDVLDNIHHRQAFGGPDGRLRFAVIPNMRGVLVLPREALGAAL